MCIRDSHPPKRHSPQTPAIAALARSLPCPQRHRPEHQAAFKVDWESLLALAPDVGAAEPLTPAMRADGLAAARAWFTSAVSAARAERGAWVATSRKLLDRAGHRYQSVLAGLPARSSSLR